MDGPPNDHSDSDSGESWILVDDNLASEGGPFQVSQNIHKSFIENYEKDEDTDGISIISDSEPESPSSFLVDSCHSILEAQTVKEEIPVYSTETIDFTANINNENNNEENITGDSIKHKIYVHRRNNRLSTVLNIMMLVSVMTAAGVAIGHMWGAKNDCPSQATPSFNKILSDLYKLQAENAHYRNKLRELSLIIEDNLQNECEKESEISNNSKLQTYKCRQQKIDEIQKYLKSSIGEGRKYKRSVIAYAQNPEDSEYTKKIKGENEFRKFVNANISKFRAVKEQKIDEKLIPKDDTDKLQKYNISNEQTSPDLKEVKDLPKRKISYADSLKATRFVSENNDENTYTYTEKKIKHEKKIKDLPILIESSNSDGENDFVKDGRYSIPKPKLDNKKLDRQKSHKNKKRRNKYEDWELKGGLLKDYDDLSVKLLNGNHFVKSKINANDKKRKKLNKKIENHQDTFNTNDSIKEAKYDTKLNWFDNRARLRKEARIKQELLMDSTSNSGEWYFKRMHKREECRTKENSTSKKIQNKTKNFKTRL